MQRYTKLFVLTLLTMLFVSPLPSFAIDTSGMQLYGDLRKTHFFSTDELFLIIRIGLAFVLGSLAGFTHDLRYRKTGFSIGIKTYGAVSLGAASYSSIATYIYLITGVGNSFQNIGAITSGIGFLCAAVIFKEGVTIKGLSTAATVWTTAAIGVACGAGLFGIAIAITVLISLFHVLPKGTTAID